jgi:large repetitive protein
MKVGTKLANTTGKAFFIKVQGNIQKKPKEVMMTSKQAKSAALILVAMLTLVLSAGCINSGAGGGSSSKGGPSDPIHNMVNPPGPQGPTPTTLSVNVVDESGAPINGFYWTLQEDPVYHVVPGVPVWDSPSVSIHKSNAPVLNAGTVTGSTVSVTIPGGLRSFITVLPTVMGYEMGSFNFDPGVTTATVVCHTPPLPTGQIFVNVFNDNQPLNNAPDVPVEQNLAGFAIFISDIKGEQMKDAFNNNLGTTYLLNPDGSVQTDVNGLPIMDQMGPGYVLTNTNGEALIKYINPGFYPVIAVPPPGSDWIQTSTIDGTPAIDAWIRHNEPPWMNEFGVFSWHVSFGFVQPKLAPVAGGTVGSISGKAVYLHDARSPLAAGQFSGPKVDYCWVGLNDLSGSDQLLVAQPCFEDGTFIIDNVPPGTWQLVVWDYSLDAIIDFRTVIMPSGGANIDLGDVQVAAWFGRMQGSVFNDTNNNGFRDPGEAGIPDQVVNIRDTDGSVFYTTFTDAMGNYAFQEIYPFGRWLVDETDSTRYKSTGLTVVVDEGGTIQPGNVNTPQLQPDNGNLPWRTELGEAWTEGMIVYDGQISTIDFAKTAYGSTESGLILGAVYYATTRAEDDPRYAVMEPWEPAIPRVQLALYLDANDDDVIDDLNADGLVTLADVDNYPLGWSTGGAKGPEDVDYNNNGIYDAGDAVKTVWTDSWDDKHPTGSVEPVQLVHGHTVVNGAETINTWNQMRPGVFDGSYEFNSYFPGGQDSGSTEVVGIPPNYYIVGVAVPPGYKLAKEEDKNVVFGEIPFPAKAPKFPVAGVPICDGDNHVVPAELTLFPGTASAFAGETKKLCDYKKFRFSYGENINTNFALYTEAPVGGFIYGLILNDIGIEYDPLSPNYGQNIGPSWMPVSIQTWDGREIQRVYSDEWGKYVALVPSTYTINPPAPSGVAPGVLNICVNDPGPVPDPLHPGQTMDDPWYNPSYSVVCSNFQFFAGKTTDLDTPILPLAAFSENKTPLDCESGDGSPEIASVSAGGAGPYLASTPGNITITARGTTIVPNPAYDPAILGSTPTILRDFGFGATTGTVTLDGTPLAIVSWSATSITATVPGGAATGQLLVTRGDNGNTSVIGITVHVANAGISAVINVSPGQSIQAAIDGAPDNALILIAPGVYTENLIVTRPLKIQGWGAYSTTIKAGQMDPNQQAAWDAKVSALIASGAMEMIPGERTNFFLEKGSGVLESFASTTVIDPANPPLVDGLLIRMAIQGGGIFVNAFGKNIHLSNNRITGNQGNFGGGIRIGTPSLLNVAGDGYLSSQNTDLVIHHNQITTNGGIDGGGGLAIFNGADNYSLTNNFICGNFTLSYGGGVSHFGLSPNGNISNNVFLSNQGFDEGGGVMLAGELTPAGAPVGTLTEGCGNVMIDSNDFIGNMTGDDGGAIRTLMTNGKDVQAHSADPTQWHRIDILNNIITNNLSWDAGAGIGLDDSARIFIINNTIAHNDATGNGVDAFGTCTTNVPAGQICPPGSGGGAATVSHPLPAGIYANAHSTGLIAAFDASVAQTFSNPVLEDNIIYQNRSFYWDGNYNGGIGGLRPDLAAAETVHYWDLAVYNTPAPQLLSPMNSILTDATGYDPSNVAADPLFVDGTYFNSFLGTSKTAATGLFITITFKLPGSHGNYHIQAGSPALNLGGATVYPGLPQLNLDIDGESRPFSGGVDSGADEKH